MNYKFSTQYFALTDTSILFLRNRFPYREIKSPDVAKIELTKGTDVKRPVLSFIFGGALIITALFLMTNFNYSSTGEGRLLKAVGYWMVMELTIFALGSFSIYRAVPMHPVIKFTFTTGETESMALQEVIKDKRLQDLMATLREVVGLNRISVDKEFES